MTDAEEREQEIQEEFAKCKTFRDYRDLVSSYDTSTGYNEAFELIGSADDAFSLAWAAQGISDESFVTKALSKCLDLAKHYDEEDSMNSLSHVVHHHDWQWFYDSIFQDLDLVKKMAEIHGLEMP